MRCLVFSSIPCALIVDADERRSKTIEFHIPESTGRAVTATIPDSLVVFSHVSTDSSKYSLHLNIVCILINWNFLNSASRENWHLVRNRTRLFQAKTKSTGEKYDDTLTMSPFNNFKTWNASGSIGPISSIKLKFTVCN